VPELIEVERYRLLAEGTVGRTVTAVGTPDAWFLKGPTTAAALDAVLVGNRITDARRIGKLLLLDVEGGPVVGVRFGMTGTLLLDDVDTVGPLLYAPTRTEPAWERWSLDFADGGRLVVHDPRRLGGVTLDPDVSGLGPDATDVDAAQLAAALDGSSVPLKARLLDQSRIAGIGNLIADELLWRAALSPLRPAGSLSEVEVERLHRTLMRTLAELTGRGGCHLGDMTAERHPGGCCPRDGSPLVRTTVGGRTSWWCPVHQV
jgi:formamidopyrimidine-DNA glycosylase